MGKRTPYRSIWKEKLNPRKSIQETVLNANLMAVGKAYFSKLKQYEINKTRPVGKSIGR